MKPASFVFILLITLLTRAHAEFQLAQIFQDHMVLQQGKPCPIWGWADPNTEVTATFAGQTKKVKADAQGYWKAIFDPLTASAEGKAVTIEHAGQSKVIKDVLVGEVWLCAGQSNMGRALKNDAFDYPFFKTYAEDAEYPAIRFIHYSMYAADKPQKDFDNPVQKNDKWQLLNKTSAMECMSLPFFFSKELYKTLNVPIGLVEVAISGTPHTAWISKETNDEVAAEVKTAPNFEKLMATKDAQMAKANLPYKSWSEFAAADAAWRTNPTGRWPGSENLVSGMISDFPAVLYNAMVYPAAPFAIHGVLWHQGESGPGQNYKERLIAQLKDWRKLFNQDFYFIWGSLTRTTNVSPPLLPNLKAPRAGMNEEFLLADQSMMPDGKAVLVNFCDLGNSMLHWGRREEGGHRFAGAALAAVYHKPTIFTGPELINAQAEGSTIKARFRYIGSGLVYEPSIEGISGFILQQKGADPELRWASSVKVDGDTVVISDPAMPKPTNVYYGWHDNPHETLFNKEGYTAYPFRAVPRAELRGVNTPAGQPLVELMAPAKGVGLNLSHVRRHGFIFSVVQTRTTNAGNAKVQVNTPAEWKEVKFSSKGAPVQPVEKGNSSGGKTYEFEVPVNGGDVLVTDAANPPDFSKVNRF